MSGLNCQVRRYIIFQAAVHPSPPLLRSQISCFPGFTASILSSPLSADILYVYQVVHQFSPLLHLQISCSRSRPKCLVIPPSRPSTRSWHKLLVNPPSASLPHIEILPTKCSQIKRSSISINSSNSFRDALIAFLLSLTRRRRRLGSDRPLNPLRLTPRPKSRSS